MYDMIMPTLEQGESSNNILNFPTNEVIITNGLATTGTSKVEKTITTERQVHHVINKLIDLKRDVIKNSKKTIITNRVIKRISSRFNNINVNLRTAKSTTHNLTLDYEKAGFRLYDGIFNSPTLLDGDKLYVNKIPITQSAKKITESNDSNSLDFTFSLLENKDRTDAIIIGNSVRFDNENIISINKNSSNGFTYTNNLNKVIDITHCTVFTTNNENTEIEYRTDKDIIRRLIPGESISFNTFNTANIAFIVYKEVKEIPVTFTINTKRQVVKDVKSTSKSKRIILKNANKTIKVKRKVAINKVCYLDTVRHITKTNAKVVKVDTRRMITVNTFNIVRTRRKTLSSIENTILTKRRIVKNKDGFLDSIRMVEKSLRKTIRIDTSRITAINTFNIVRTRRKIIKAINSNEFISTKRRVSARNTTLIGLERKIAVRKVVKGIRTRRDIAVNTFKIIRTRRRTNKSTIKNTRTRRSVVDDSKNIARTDTKRAIINIFEGSISTNRKTAINKEVAIDNTFRKVIHNVRKSYSLERKIIKNHIKEFRVYRIVTLFGPYETNIRLLRKVVDSKEVGSEVHRTIIKDINSLAKTKRVVQPVVNVFTDLNRRVVLDKNKSYKSFRKVIKNPNLNSLDTKRCTSINKNNIIKTLRITRFKVNSIKSLDSIRRISVSKNKTYDSDRTIVISNNKKVDLKRYVIAQGDVIGIALRRKIVNAKMKDLDILRKAVKPNNKNVDLSRDIAIYTEDKVPTNRFIVNKVNTLVNLNRKIIKDHIISLDTNLKISSTNLKSIELKRIVSSGEAINLDISRKILSRISKNIDTAKKVTNKYIYLLESERKAVYGLETNIDLVISLYNFYEVNFDLSRKVTVPVEKLRNTLIFNFELKHGALYKVNEEFIDVSNFNSKERE